MTLLLFEGTRGATLRDIGQGGVRALGMTEQQDHDRDDDLWVLLAFAENQSPYH